MKSVRIRGKVLSYLCLLVFCHTSQAQVTDSVRCLMHEEISFIEKYLQRTSVDCYRGITTEEWESTIKTIHEKVDSVDSIRDYRFALRQFGTLINDSHGEFPDEGVYNRTGVFKDDDCLFPIWVKIWKDGRVFVEEELSGHLPPKSEILEINGHSVAHLVERMRRINPSERNYAIYKGETISMVDPYIWNSFTNYLFCEGITSPFELKYVANDSIASIKINGIERSKYKEWFDNGVGKEVMEKDRPKYYFTKLGKDAISYSVISDSIAVVKISYWMGSNILRLAINRNDPGFIKKIDDVMASVIRNGYPHLVFDLRGNPGGYVYNAYHLLSYFSTDPIPLSDVYKVTENNKKYIKKLLKEQFSKAAHRGRIKETYEALENTKEGGLFRSDSLLTLHYAPAKHKCLYQGKMYVLTDGGSSSTSITFAEAVKKYKIGTIVGSSPGGYTVMTSGNALPKYLPFSKRFTIDIPFVLDSRYLSEGYNYLTVDIPLEPELQMCLDGYDALDDLIKQIKKEL